MDAAEPAGLFFRVAAEAPTGGADAKASGAEGADEATDVSGAPGGDGVDGDAGADGTCGDAGANGADGIAGAALGGPGSRTRLQKVQGDGTLPHFVPDRRERLLDALALIGRPADEPIRTRLWGHVTIDAARCNGCRMCAVFCPTGALVRVGGAMDADGGQVGYGLDHFPGDCVKCRCCEDICPCGALRVDDEVRAPFLLDGAVEHMPLPRPEHMRGDALTTKFAFRDLLGSDAVFDR